MYTIDKSDRNYLISKEIILRILKQKSILNKSKLNVYFQGIKLNNQINFDEYAFNKKSSLKLFYDNYHNLENKLSWFNYIMYHDLMFTFNYKLKVSPSFFNFFNNIKLIEVNFNDNLNPDHFNWFLNNCPNLNYLYIKNAIFNQHFYHDLIINCKLLINFYLQINKNIENLDYNFSIKFRLLKEFKTSQHIPMNLIYHILIKLKFIEYLAFQNRKSRSIKKINLNRFKFRYGSKKWLNLERNELINLCNHLELNEGKSELYSSKIVINFAKIDIFNDNSF